MTPAQACSACGAGGTEQLIDFGVVPRSGVFLSAPDAPVSLRSLAFEFCPSCGLVRQRRFAESAVDYTDVVRRTDRQLPGYVDEILDRLLIEAATPQGLTVEVGANDGTFLSRLAAAGVQKRLGVEPSRALAKLCAEAGHPVEAVHLTEGGAPFLRAVHGAARAVVCRHTLEHVPDPTALLRAMRLLLAEDGVLFLEVPAVSPILDELKAFELWDEHLTYFSVENLPAILLAAGFQVGEISMRDHLVSKNILCWAYPARAVAAPSPPSAGAAHLVSSCRDFARRWHAYRAEARTAAARWQAPVVAIGASHPQSNYLLFSGVGERVSMLVDDDPMKVGKYVALPRPTPIISSEQLLSEKCVGTLLLTAFGYDGWMNRIKRGLVTAAPCFVDVLDELTRR